MEIKYGESRIFAVNKEDVEMGELTYTLKGDDVIVADHTEVNDDFRGEGVGDKLVEALVEKAREDQRKIKADCPFVKKVLKETATYHDVFLNV